MCRRHREPRRATAPSWIHYRSLVGAESRLSYPLSYGLVVTRPGCPGVLCPGVRGGTCALRVAFERNVEHRKASSRRRRLKLMEHRSIDHAPMQTGSQ